MPLSGSAGRRKARVSVIVFADNSKYCFWAENRSDSAASGRKIEGFHLIALVAPQASKVIFAVFSDDFGQRTHEISRFKAARMLMPPIQTSMQNCDGHPQGAAQVCAHSFPGGGRSFTHDVLTAAYDQDVGGPNGM